MSTAAGSLATWGVGLGTSAIPDEVRRIALRHALDGLGNAVSAARSGAAMPAVVVAKGLGGPPESTLLGSRTSLGAPAAALAAAVMVHAHDFDDTHTGGLVHATAAALPTALAVAEQVGASGREFVDAFVVGLEVTCRVGAAAPHAFHQRGLHATAVAGVFASALMTARLIGLDGDRATHALGIAGSSAGGLLEFLGSGASTKQLHPGLAAHAGILAARLAAAGATGPDSVFEGSRGLYAALAATSPDLDALVGGLGMRWEASRIGIKPYPACQLMHAALAATEAVLAEHPELRPADVAEVEAVVHPDSAAVVCDPARDNTRPQSGYDAKFSLPWSLAALLTDRNVWLATYEPSSLARPEVAALAARVRTRIVDPGIVAGDAPGEVTIRTTDGRTLVGSVERSPGGPDHPLSDEAMLAKLSLNCASTGGARELAGLVAGADGLDSVTPIIRLIAELAEDNV